MSSSSTSRTASLRDLYIDPASAWSFVPTQQSVPDPPAPSYKWSNRPPHNSIFDLSPSLDLNEPSRLDVPLLLKSLVASAVLQYSSTAIAMPWEVAKLLLQVQWVPRDAGEPEEPELIQDNDDAVRIQSTQYVSAALLTPIANSDERDVLE
jgi:fusion and transport protein UGO1